MSKSLKNFAQRHKILQESEALLNELTLINANQVQIRKKALVILNITGVILLIVILLGSFLITDQLAAPSPAISILSAAVLVGITLYFLNTRFVSTTDGLVVAILCTCIFAVVIWFNGIYPVFLLPIVALTVTILTSPRNSLILNSISLGLICIPLFLNNTDLPIKISVRVLLGSIFLVAVSNLIIRENRRISTSAEKITKNLRHLISEISDDLSLVTRERDNARNTDQISGLLNEISVVDSIKKLINSSNKTSPIAIINLHFLNLEKHLAAHQINIQNEVVPEITNRIKDLFKTKYIGRYGKWNFIIAMEIGPSEIVFQQKLQNIFLALNKVLNISNNLIPSMPQMGVAYWPENAQKYDELIRYAQVALLNSIENNISEPVYFDQQMELDLAQKTYLSEQISSAIRNNEFKVFYQPVFDIKNKTFKKAEAVIRWDHPQRGILVPSTFIPLAINNHQIVDLTNWVINAVENDLKVLTDEIDSNFQISINLSPHYLEKHLVNEHLVDLLPKNNFIKNKIIFEITEESILKTDERTIQLLNNIKSSGFQIALDDFGMGYSCLANLNTLPIDYIKLDKSLIDGLEQIPMNIRICKLITDLSHSSGWKVVAEGVENANQLSLLTEMNIDYIQGYYYSKPLPVDELKAFLKQPD